MERPPYLEPTEVNASFLKAAQAEGAIESYKVFSASQDPTRNVNILVLFRGTHLMETELAKTYKLSKQRVSQIIHRTTMSIWEKCSPEVQLQYPLSEIGKAKAGKKQGGQTLSENKAKIVSNLLSKIMDDEKIAIIAKTSIDMVKNQRIYNRKIKAENTALRTAKIKETKSRVNKIILNSDDLDLVQNAIGILTEEMAVTIVRKNKAQFTPLSKIFATSPTRRLPLVADTLIANSFPVLRIYRNKVEGKYSTINYYLRTQDVLQIKDYLTQSTPFKPEINKVYVFHGEPPKQFPNTTELQRKYKAVFSGIATNADKHLGKNKRVTAKELLTGCPVTIFRYHRGFFVHPDSYSRLQKFLKKRLQELDLPLATG